MICAPYIFVGTDISNNLLGDIHKGCPLLRGRGVSEKGTFVDRGKGGGGSEANADSSTE